MRRYSYVAAASQLSSYPLPTSGPHFASNFQHPSNLIKCFKNNLTTVIFTSTSHKFNKPKSSRKIKSSLYKKKLHILCASMHPNLLGSNFCNNFSLSSSTTPDTLSCYLPFPPLLAITFTFSTAIYFNFLHLHYPLKQCTTYHTTYII